MKKILLYILTLLPAMLLAESNSKLQVAPVLTNSVTEAQQDSLDAEAAEKAIEELVDMADSINAAEAVFCPQVSIQQTEIDRQMLDLMLGWLDTTSCVLDCDTTPMTDSIYRTRLESLPNVMPMPYNPVVKNFIEMYVYRRPRQVAALQRLGEYYFPIFEDKLMQYDMPQELKYLAVIESALNASARSHAGAAGLWQFMPSTGRLYGLEVNSLIDERLDPYKSTDAACRFLKSLYRVFGDWHLALAAYNCGPGNVNKAMRRSGKRGFWDIYPYLPRETRSYVPIFIAANYALTYAEDHGICPDTLWTNGVKTAAPCEMDQLAGQNVRLKQRGEMMPMLVDTIHTQKRQHLKQTADVLGLSINELRRLNPAYIKDVIPGGKTYSLVLPTEYVGAYIQYEDSILAYKADSLINQQKAVIEASLKATVDNSYSVNGVTIYKVKKGDTLGAIAKKYHCTVAQLQKWNGLKGTNLQIGQKLKIKK